jgi:predicted hydrolase (HD superfamily)
MIPTREYALILLSRYNKSESLTKHALSVEAVMRHFASLFNEDIEKWGIIGLIHDLDYEQYPDEHCTMTRKILQEEQWPEEYIHAVVSHGWGICSDTEPVHVMEKVLFTIDELTGLVTASVLIRPSKSIYELELKSVKKKWPLKNFAAGANREVIEKGAAMMGEDLDFIIQETINGMKSVAAEIGLAGV